MSCQPNGMIRKLAAMAILGMTACGGGSSGDVDAGPDIDGDVQPPEGKSCTEGGRASSDRYFPFEVGNEWRYLVRDEASGEAPGPKAQNLNQMITPDEETGPVIVQITEKDSGRTENWLRLDGNAVVRLQQQDFDERGNLERTTYYLPYRLRLDESPERLVPGTVWTEDYVSVVEDSAGIETKRETVSDQWTVVAVDEPCDTPWGELQCLHVRVDRLAGGVSQKDYWFAKGYGKVREEGGVTEELIDCNLK